MASPMQLPLDVCIDILVRLPVRSLARFRCVSRSFRSLIDGQDFVNRYVNHSIETDSNLRLFLSVENSKWKRRFFSLSFDPYALDNFSEIDLPLMKNCKFDYIIGSCNGLLALEDSRRNIMLVLNPLTKRYRVLPKFYRDLSRVRSVVGFGFDVGSSDFKLVQIPAFSKPVNHTDVAVFSLRLNSWRRIQDFPYFWVCGGNSAFVNGALHWVAALNQDADRNDIIIAFGLKNGEFYQVPLPPIVGIEGYCIVVEALGGCLCLVCKFDDDDERPWDLWVMKEYGVKDSWTKLATLMNVGDGYVKPLVYSRSEDKVLVHPTRGDLCWYDLERNRVRSIVEIDDKVRRSDRRTVFVNTLVSPNAYTGN